MKHRLHPGGVGGLLFVAAQLLHVDSFGDLVATDYRVFSECLALSQLAHDTCLLEFSFEFLQSPFDVLAFFNWYYNHN